MNLLRSAVSSDRRRYRADDYDLDLTYITERIIAMGFPSSGMEGVYRNHINDVKRFLDEKHRDKYMVFNLSGRKYDNSKFFDRVLEFGWPDHHSPPLHMLYDICHSIESWLRADPEHVVVVHCIAGKGRTGTVISAFLLWEGTAKTSAEALTLFARMRSERSIGVQYPSQHRCVRYFEASIPMSRQGPPSAEELVLSSITMHGIPNYNEQSDQPGCFPILHVMKAPFVIENIENAETIFRSPWEANPVPCSESTHVFRVDRLVKGDVLVRVYHCPKLTQTFGGTGPTAKLMFRFAFHTYFENGTFTLERKDIDVANLEKNNRRYPDGFRVEIKLEKPQADRDYSKDLVSERIKVKKEGWLNKQGKINTAYRKRWFLLNDNFLSYYRSKTDSNPAGTIPLEHARLYIMNEKPHTMALRTLERTFIISADSAKELESWMAAIIHSKSIFAVEMTTNSLTQVLEREEGIDEALEHSISQDTIISRSPRPLMNMGIDSPSHSPRRREDSEEAGQGEDNSNSPLERFKDFDLSEEDSQSHGRQAAPLVSLK